MNLPEDPFMLLSMINMKMRDGDYNSLSDLCQSLGINEPALVSKLKAHGFEWNSSVGQFR